MRHQRRNGFGGSGVHQSSQLDCEVQNRKGTESGPVLTRLLTPGWSDWLKWFDTEAGVSDWKYIKRIMMRCELKWGTRIVIVSHNTSGWSDRLKWFHTEPGWSFCVPTPVDRPTQLICISDTYLYLFVFLCKQTNTKDIAGQSATPTQKFLNEVQENRMILDNDKVWNQMRNFGAQTRIVRRANDDLCINILISKMVIFSPRYLVGGLLGSLSSPR